MRTLDPSTITRRIEATIAKFPPNSVSKREVVATVPLGKDPEAQFARLDARLTKVVYDDAAEAYKRNSGKPFMVVPSQELERLTGVVRRALESEPTRPSAAQSRPSSA